MEFNLVILGLFFYRSPSIKDTSSRQVSISPMETYPQEDRRSPLTPPQISHEPGPSPHLTSQAHTKAGLILLATLSVAEAVIPTLGLYRPLATGLLYLTRLAPILYWSPASGTPPPVQQSWTVSMPGRDTSSFKIVPRSQIN